ncbi:MAG: hypothetical protein WC216_10605 [Gallionella sp.]|jgi:hypothetical protein
MRLIVLALCAFAQAALADETDWHNSWDGMLYGYASSLNLRNDSVLNPGNQLARLAQRSDNIEARLNLRAENETLRFTARPILAVRDAQNAIAPSKQQEAYLSQWQLRIKAGDNANLAAGREVLNFGPAQFRSPSSPFYFDNGRSNPMRELPGMDVLKVSLTTGHLGNAQLVRVLGSGYSSILPDPWRNSWLMKYDNHGENSAAGLAVAKPENRAIFLGAHGQFTVNDALLLYGELSSSTQANALNSPADPALPFLVSAESARKFTGLTGLAYTFENSQSLYAEYLHDGHGYSADQQRAYFRRATTVPGLAFGLAPRLLGRDYLHLVWQSNLMESRGYWRLMATHSLTDSGNELGGYGEYSLNPHTSAFLLGVLPAGSAQQEFSGLFRYSVSAGLKVALP